MTREIYKTLNEPFKKLYSVDLRDALTKVPELKLQERKSHAEKKKVSRAKAVQNKNIIEEHWSTVDADTLLGTRQSYSQRNQQRQSLFFESHEEASTRTAERKQLEENGERLPKRHSPDHRTCTFQRAELLEEVNNMKDGSQVCS